MNKYQKKPIVIEASIYQEGMEDYYKYNIPMFGLFTKEECITSGFTPDFEKDKIPFIKTLEGELAVQKGDYIITGVKGERYPCKPDIFDMTYEEVNFDTLKAEVIDASTYEKMLCSSISLRNELRKKHDRGMGLTKEETDFVNNFEPYIDALLDVTN